MQARFDFEPFDDFRLVVIDHRHRVSRLNGT